MNAHRAHVPPKSIGNGRPLTIVRFPRGTMARESSTYGVPQTPTRAERRGPRAREDDEGVHWLLDWLGQLAGGAEGGADGSTVRRRGGHWTLCWAALQTGYFHCLVLSPSCRQSGRTGQGGTGRARVKAKVRQHGAQAGASSSRPPGSRKSRGHENEVDTMILQVIPGCGEPPVLFHQ